MNGRGLSWRTAAAFGVYGLLLTGYVTVVLHLLEQPLRLLFEGHAPVYAVVALALIVVQGIGLEWLASWLLSRFIPGWAE